MNSFRAQGAYSQPSTPTLLQNFKNGCLGWGKYTGFHFPEFYAGTSQISELIQIRVKLRHDLDTQPNILGDVEYDLNDVPMFWVRRVRFFKTP